MRKCKIPTIEECYDLLKQCHVPAHIIRHCEAAAKLAVDLAKKISANNTQVDIDFVHRACLLHDIMRVCDFYEPIDSAFDTPPTEEDIKWWKKFHSRFNGLNHEQAGYEYLKADYPELALAIAKHAYLAIIDEKLQPKTIEEKLIYYADKRAMHDCIVPLAERLEEGHKRNAKSKRKRKVQVDVDYVDGLIFELEKELFALAGENLTTNERQ